MAALRQIILELNRLAVTRDKGDVLGAGRKRRFQPGFVALALRCDHHECRCAYRNFVELVEYAVGLRKQIARGVGRRGMHFETNLPRPRGGAPGPRGGGPKKKEPRRGGGGPP